MIFIYDKHIWKSWKILPNKLLFYLYFKAKYCIVIKAITKIGKKEK